MNVMELRPEERLEKAILWAKSNNLKISRDAMMEWRPDLISVDAIGAFIYCHLDYLKFRKGFPKRWLKEVLTKLNVDIFWFHRFNMGFNQRHQILIDISKTERPEFVEDNISKLGIQLSKKYCD